MADSTSTFQLTISSLDDLERFLSIVSQGGKTQQAILQAIDQLKTSAEPLDAATSANQPQPAP